VRWPRKFNVYLCQKVPFVLTCFQASAAPRPENSDSDEKDALFDLDTQIIVYLLDIIIFDFLYLVKKLAILVWKILFHSTQVLCTKN
jgi:hypothetical protein